MESELAEFIYTHALPEALDVEAARRLILDELRTLPPYRTETAEALISHVRDRFIANWGKGPIPEGQDAIDPDLHAVKAEMAASEALQSLHALGVIVASGDRVVLKGGSTASGDVAKFVVRSPRRSVPVLDVTIPFPAVHYSYRLATPFRGASFRIATGDAYLSHLDQSLLPSRAKRCLQECVDAFRHGLYLSAAMNAGAASESLWMEVGRLVDAKTLSTKKLGDELKKPYPNIGVVLEEAWQALVSHCPDILSTIFATSSERTIFKQHADRLRDRRNYAVHSDDADVDEPLFTYNETGMLLLDAADYFNTLARLKGAVDAMTKRP